MENETSFNWVMSLSLSQKLSGIFFILAKVLCISAVPLIFASFTDKKFLSFASYLVYGACFLLVSCIVSGIISMKNNNSNIDELLNNPEMRKLIEEKLKSI